MIKLIIADENHSYAKALAQYMLEEHGQSFEIACFTQASVLKEYLKTCGMVDILLVDEKLQCLKEYFQCAKAVVTLLDKTCEDENGSIYKYQRADLIAKRLLELSDKLIITSVKQNQGKGRCRLICVYSPSGAVGKTTVAYNLACQFSFHTQKVLLLSMESYTEHPIFQRHEAARGLMYLLYLIKNRTPNLQLKLNALRAVDQNSNIHYMERETNVLEYKDIKIEDMSALAEFLRIQSDYDAVIFDLDSAMNEISLGAFKYCDVIVNVFVGNNLQSGKQKDFMWQLPKVSDFLGESISDKMIGVANKVEKAAGDEVAAAAYHESILLMEVPYINNISVNQGVYFPEMIYFKKLYDAIGSFFLKRGL